MTSTLTGIFRSPVLILAEIAAIALVCLIGLLAPSLHMFRSAGFILITVFASLSLILVIGGQWRRCRSAWSLPLALEHFQSAPLRSEFTRPSRSIGHDSSLRITSHNKLGLAGSCVFHSGLLAIIIAGILRALFASEAMTDLIEGETLSPSADAWTTQSPGMLSPPFTLDRPLALDAVIPSSSRSGGLQDLSIILSGNTLPINHTLNIGTARLFIGSDIGPAALVEESRGRRHAALLTATSRGDYEGTSPGAGGSIIHLRIRQWSIGKRPAGAEIRVMKDKALLFAGQVRVGETITLPGGDSMTLRGLPFWVRLHAFRDASLWMAYAGFALAMAGATLMFALVRVDTCVAVTPAGDLERVFVAIKPHRFAPLYRDRFKKLVQAEGGSL